MYFPPQAVCMLPVTTRIPVASVHSLLGHATMYVLHTLCLLYLYLALSPSSRLIDAPLRYVVSCWTLLFYYVVLVTPTRPRKRRRSRVRTRQSQRLSSINYLDSGDSIGEADATNNCASGSEAKPRRASSPKLVLNQLLRAGYALVYRCLLYARVNTS